MFLAAYIQKRSSFVKRLAYGDPQVPLLSDSESDHVAQDLQQAAALTGLIMLDQRLSNSDLKM